MEHGPLYRLAGTIGNWIFVIGVVAMVLVMIFGDGGSVQQVNTDLIGRYGD